MVWTVTVQNWNKSFSRWHRTSCRNGWPRGFGSLIPNPLTPEYLFRVSVLFLTYLLPLRSKYIHTTPKCGRQNLYDVWRTTFEIGAAQLQKWRQNHRSYAWTRSPISPVWLPVWYDFRYSMNIASVCRFVSRLCRTAWIVRTSAQKKPNSHLSSLPLVSAASVVFFPHYFLFFYWAFIRCSQTLWDYVLLLVRKDRIRVLSLRYIL